jgi:hypothetical protein
MRRLLPVVLRPWVLPLLVIGLVVPAVAAFSFVGPQLGLAVGALTVGAVVAFAARLSYDEEIEVAGSADDRYRVLVVAAEPLSDPAVVARIAERADQGASSGVAGGEGPPELRVVAPALTSMLDRWASDVEAARDRAARALAVSLAALATAGLDAGGRVGDGNPVQAIEDELRAYPAQEVVVVDGPGLGAEHVEEVRRRLDRPVIELRPADAQGA